jgi:hypothetical protein
MTSPVNKLNRPNTVNNADIADRMTGLSDDVDSVGRDDQRHLPAVIAPDGDPCRWGEAAVAAAGEVLDDLHGALDAFAVGEGHVEDFDAVAGCDVRWASPSPGTPSADSTVRPTSIIAIGLRRLPKVPRSSTARYAAFPWAC